MKMKNLNIFITILIVALLASYAYIRKHTIKKYFAEEKYYSILTFLGVAHPHYKPYKNFFEIFDQEGINYDLANEKVIESSLNDLSLLSNLPQVNTIPKITHQVYFTNKNQENNFKGFLLENLKLFTKNISKNGSWKNYIWTNNPALFKGVDNIIILDISEFKDHPLYPILLKTIKQGENSKAFYAESSDMVRLLALQKFGGIYKDMDYEVYNYDLLNDLISKFDFIGGRERYNIRSYYGNSFIASKANHPIINKAIAYIQRNHSSSSETPTYIKFPSIQLDSIYFNGPPVITFAYFAKNNQEGNHDIILPPWMIYNMNLAHTLNKRCDLGNMPVKDFWRIKQNQTKLIEEFIANFEGTRFNDDKDSIKYHNIYYNSNYHSNYQIIGADMFCGSWVSKHKFKHIFYWKIPFLETNEKN